MKWHLKKRNKKYNIIFLTCLIIVFFIVIFVTINDNRNLTIVEKIIKDGVLNVNKVILYPFNYFDNMKEKKLAKIEEKVKLSYETEIDSLKKETQELKESLGLNSLFTEYDIISATVISRNLGYWYNNITVDKGSKSGIKENMAVITKEGLIGKVIKTTRNTSTIKLLTSEDANNKVSVQIKTNENFSYGILTYFDNDTKEYIVEGITEQNILEGSLVSTTGLGDIFPSGILVGTVTKVTKDNFDLDTIIRVKPSVEIDNFNYVHILRKKQ